MATHTGSARVELTHNYFGASLRLVLRRHTVPKTRSRRARCDLLERHQVTAGTAAAEPPDNKKAPLPGLFFTFRLVPQGRGPAQLNR